MAYLKKIKDMGSAKSDDPNASEPSIRFKPNVGSSIEVFTPSGIQQAYKSNRAQVPLELKDVEDNLLDLFCE